MATDDSLRLSASLEVRSRAACWASTASSETDVELQPGARITAAASNMPASPRARRKPLLVRSAGATRTP